MTSAPELPPVRRSRWRWVGGSCLAFCIVVAIVVFVWDWNWFRPLAEARASIALGRAVTMERIAISPGRVVGITAYGVKIANPDGFSGPAFGTISRLDFKFEAETWWRTGRIVLPAVVVDQPNFDAEQSEAGQSNWVFSSPSPAGQKPSPEIEIGNLQVNNGQAHVHLVPDKSDLMLNISTSPAANGGRLDVTGKGTYAHQPITIHAVGGALLSLRDTTAPYPVDLELANGETRITLKGHIRDPMAMSGADLNLVLSGPDMALLYPILGIATPRTPSYQISGRLDFGDGRIKFTNMAGRVGSSDLNGELDVDPRAGHRVLLGNLISHHVDMDDLAGFIGSTPGRTTTPGQTPQQIEEVKRAEANPKMMPTVPISMPKVKAVDVHITYRGEKIIGQNIPFDSISAKLDIDNGHIRVAPLQLGIGNGAVRGTIDMTPVGNEVDADADITVDHVDISRLLATAGLGKGEGSLDGTAKVKGRGASLSAVLAHGDGMFRAVMPLGGDVNSLLIDLMGEEVGRAVFAAIGVPDKERISCMVADFVLQKGILASRELEMDTSDHVISGGGRIDLDREVLEMQLRSDSKSFTIGKLAAPIIISGSFKHLHFAPAPELALRGGVAVGLGILFPPAALLPTIQFGVGDHSPCAAAAKP
jgi:AsmA family protein